MRIVIGGASGLIGTALAARLQAGGDEIVRLVRRESAGPAEISWAPGEQKLDPGQLSGVDAVVNLSGATLSRLPWTRGYRREILASRVSATRAIVTALHGLAARDEPLPALISASASGYYGNRPGETLDESTTAGGGFLPDVVRAWESAALAAPPGARVVLARTGLVLARTGGALGPLRALAFFGLAGPINGGGQHWPWITLEDEVSALTYLIRSRLEGPVNLAGPTPATAAEVVHELARTLRRPYWLPLPLATLMGQAGRELLAADQRVRPSVLLGDGFEFAHRTVSAAIRAVTK